MRSIGLSGIASNSGAATVRVRSLVVAGNRPGVSRSDWVMGRAGAWPTLDWPVGRARRAGAVWRVLGAGEVAWRERPRSGSFTSRTLRAASPGPTGTRVAGRSVRQNDAPIDVALGR